LVTGASSGIGRAVALQAAGAGRNIALVALPGAMLDDAVASCRSLGVEALGIAADVTDAGAVDAAFAQAEELGPIEAVYNAAGTSVVAGVTETTDEQWAHQLATNLSGTFFVTRAAARVMVPRRHGAIVTTGSELALTGQAGYVGYSATKGGVVAMTRALAAELAPYGVRANVVCPGTVDTPLLQAEFDLAEDPDGEREDTERSIALGRIAHPDEIASVVLFLLSGESSYVTGAQIVVDGGRTSTFPQSQTTTMRSGDQR
jgi:NAD(P)-dependent dehydrogenase (short-subunit alcohol dehydrogenase family)